MNTIDESYAQYYSSENESETNSEYNSEKEDSANEMSLIAADDSNGKVKTIELEELQESYYYNTFWSAKEKEQLFKGIERYGKYDIDKIKRLLPNKSDIDIRMYIGLLHKKYKFLKKNRSQSLYTRDEIYNFYENGIIESTEDEIKEEEEKAVQLIAEEQTKVNSKNEFDRMDYGMILRLFNIELMLSLTTKLFIRKRNATIHKDTLIYIYLQYVQWLRKVIKTVILVTEKRQLKKKTKSKCYISIEDLNETFYILNYNNYQVDSPLSKLLFRRQGHFILNALFRIRHSFKNFVHPDIKKSIIDENTNTWTRPYDLQPRYYHSKYNEYLNEKDPSKVKEYFDKWNDKKKEIYYKYMKEHGLYQDNNNKEKNNKDTNENKSTNGNDENDNLDSTTTSTTINNNDDSNNDNNSNNESSNNEDNNNDDTNNNDNDDDLEIPDDQDFDNILISEKNNIDNEEKDEEINEEENEENDYDEENNEEEDDDDEIEGSISEESTTDDNYYDSNYDEESNIDKLVSSNFITRRSNRRLSSAKRNREDESYLSNKKRR